MGDDPESLPPAISLKDLAEYHADVVSSLRNYFGGATHLYSRFIGYSSAEISNELALRLQETDLRSALAVMARIEAMFRIDYECRCQKRLKDNVSRAFRELRKSRHKRVRLDEDIFEVWLSHSFVERWIIGELRGAFKFRHWLAHGRYWVPKLGKKYDFTGIYLLAEMVLYAFPLIYT